MPGKYDHFHQTYESLVVLIFEQTRTMLVLYIPLKDIGIYNLIWFIKKSFWNE